MREGIRGGMAGRRTGGIVWAILWFIVLVVGVGMMMGMVWGLWILWCYVLPQVYPEGPIMLIRPGYWFFLAMWVLFVSVLGGLRGPRT